MVGAPSASFASGAQDDRAKRAVRREEDEETGVFRREGCMLTKLSQAMGAQMVSPATEQNYQKVSRDFDEMVNRTAMSLDAPVCFAPFLFTNAMCCVLYVG